ncbi:MAG TPA: hypothetical protein VIX15_14080 [Streptosporangiaceae bacterium]
MDSDQRAMAHMKLPERGILRVTEVHEGHSHEKIIGIITAPGIRPTGVDHKTAQRGRCAVGQELAVLVDRANPSRFAILWDEPATAAGSPSSFLYEPGPQPISPQDIAARVEAALDQAFQQRGRQVPPHVAARIEQTMIRLSQAGLPGEFAGEALGHAPGGYGPAGGPQYGQPFNPAGGQPYAGPGQPYGPPSDPPVGPPFGQGGQPSDPAAGSSYGQGGQWGSQPSDPAAGPSYGQGGQWGAQPYGQDATGFPQVSWTDQGGSGAGPQGGFGSAPPAQSPAGRGEPASAIVLAAQDVVPQPGFAAPGAAVDLTLEVRRADGSVYTARTTFSVPTPEARAAMATPGARLRVRIDPNDPARVEIDSYGRF